MIRVLFVCLGNICRSPMAEGIFLHLVKEAGLEDKIEADSAGTGGWQVGSQAHDGTLSILRENGIAYSGSARQITLEDLNDFDYVITMDDENLADVQMLKRQLGKCNCHIAPLLEYSREATANGIREVPDPYLQGGFDIVYRLVHAGCSGLLEAIRREHKL